MFYFTRIRVAGPYSGLYSCMSRRGEEEKRRTSSVFLLVGSGFDRFSIVECFGFLLEGILGHCVVIVEDFRKETLWCESRKSDLHGE